MRKVALLAAVALSASFANTTPSVAQDFYQLNKSTFLFLQGPGGPAATAAAPAPASKVARKKRSKK
jgi:hypothetical protein